MKIFNTLTRKKEDFVPFGCNHAVHRRIDLRCDHSISGNGVWDLYGRRAGPCHFGQVYPDCSHAVLRQRNAGDYERTDERQRQLQDH